MQRQHLAGLSVESALELWCYHGEGPVWFLLVILYHMAEKTHLLPILMAKLGCGGRDGPSVFVGAYFLVGLHRVAALGSYQG